MAKEKDYKEDFLEKTRIALAIVVVALLSYQIVVVQIISMGRQLRNFRVVLQLYGLFNGILLIVLYFFKNYNE